MQGNNLYIRSNNVLTSLHTEPTDPARRYSQGGLMLAALFNQTTGASFNKAADTNPPLSRRVGGFGV